MKLLYCARQLYQLLSIISVFLIIGSLGAWETGGISFPELAFQLLFFGGCALFCAKKAAAQSVPPHITRANPAAPTGLSHTQPHTAGSMQPELFIGIRVIKAPPIGTTA